MELLGGTENSLFLNLASDVCQRNHWYQQEALGGSAYAKEVALTGTLQVTVGEKTAAARAKIVIGAVKATRLYPTEIEDFRAI